MTEKQPTSVQPSAVTLQSIAQDLLTLLDRKALLELRAKIDSLLALSVEPPAIKQTPRPSEGAVTSLSFANAFPEPEHLVWLQKGVVTWNDWREKNREIVPDLQCDDCDTTTVLPGTGTTNAEYKQSLET